MAVGAQKKHVEPYEQPCPCAHADPGDSGVTEHVRLEAASPEPSSADASVRVDASSTSEASCAHCVVPQIQDPPTHEHALQPPLGA